MQQPFIQATLPFAITEVTPKIAPNPLSAKAEGKIKGKIKDKIKSADRGVIRVRIMPKTSHTSTSPKTDKNKNLARPATR